MSDTDISILLVLLVLLAIILTVLSKIRDFRHRYYTGTPQPVQQPLGRNQHYDHHTGLISGPPDEEEEDDDEDDEEEGS